MSLLSSPERRRWFDPHDNPAFRFDWLLLGAVGAICGLGLTMIYSATRYTNPKLRGHLSPTYHLQRQGIALAVGLVVATIVFLVDYRKLRDLWPLAYGMSLPLLLAVRFAGAGTGGTTAWFNIGPFQFQPSELAKLALIISMGGFLAAHEGDFDAWRLAQSLLLAGVPMALVMLQNDLGTMLVMAVCTIAGGVLGSHLAITQGSRWIRVVFMVVVIAVIGKFAYDILVSR